MAIATQGRNGLLRGTFVYEKANALFGQEIHCRRSRDQHKGERCVDEGDDDRHQVNEYGDQIFARHLLVQPIKLRFVMLVKPEATMLVNPDVVAICHV